MKRIQMISICSFFIAILLASFSFSQGTPAPDKPAAENPLDKRIEGPFTAYNMNIESILQLFQQEFGLQFVLEAGIEKNVSFSLDSPTVGAVLETMLPQAGLAYKVVDNVCRIGTPESPKNQTREIIECSPAMNQRLDAKLEGPYIARNQDLKTVILLFTETTKIPIILPEKLNHKVTFNLESPTAREFLEAVLKPIHLACVETMEGRLCIVTPDSQISQAQEGRVERIRKSLAVMSNVLDYMLKERLGEGYQSRGIFSKGTRGYWIPESGLVFMLGVKFPLVKPEKSETVQGEKQEKDLWDRFETKIDAGGLTGLFQDEPGTARREAIKVQATTEFDAQKIDLMRQTILEALAKYGNRFEGFRDDETITVVVEGDGGLITIPASNQPYSFTYPSSDRHTQGKTKDRMVVAQSSRAAEPFKQEGRVTIQTDKREREERGEGGQSEKAETITIQEKRETDRNPEENLVSLDRRIDEVESELRSNFDILNTHNEDQKLSEKEQILAEDNVKRVKELYESGRSSQIEVQQAEKRTIEAQKALLENQRKIIEMQKKVQSLEKELDRLKGEKDRVKNAPVVLSEKIYEEAGPLYGTLGVASNVMETFSRFEYPWPQGQNINSPVMVVQIHFRDLPKSGGKAEDIQDKVKITTY